MRSFLPWALLLLLARGAIMLALGDAYFYGEELEKATAAKAMLDGLDVAHHQLAYHYYEGGGFVVSHLKAAAFFFFGQTLFANKVVALASCMGVLGAGWWACSRAFGPASAHFFAALYVFAPAAVQKLSLISLGIHHEACIFILLALGVTGSLMESQRRWPSAALGVCLGFGVYFSWVVALAAVACALALIMRWKQRLDPSCVACCLAGGVVGSAPLLVMYVLVGEAVFDIHGTGLAAAGSSLSGTLREFFRSIYVDGALGGLAGAVCWPGAILGAIFLGLKRTDVPDEAWARCFRGFLAFLLIFVAAYLSSAFVQGAVYHFFLMLRLVPLWVVGAALVSAVLGRAWENGSTGSPVVFCGGVLVALGAHGLYGAVSEGRPMELRRNWAHLQEERGYVYPSYFQKLIPHLEGGPEDRLAVLLGFHEEQEGLLREAIAAELFRRSGPTLELDYAECMRIIESVEPGRFPDYQRGLGPLLGGWFGSDVRAGLEALQGAGSDTEVLSEAFGRTGLGVRASGGAPSLDGVLVFLVEELELVDGLSGGAAYARGVGWRLHWVLRRSVYQPWRADEFFNAVPEGLRASVEAGYHAASREGRFKPGG